MAAVTASCLGILEKCFALVAIPSHVGSYVPHFSFDQGKGLFGVAWIAVGMLFGFGSGRS